MSEYNRIDYGIFIKTLHYIIGLLDLVLLGLKSNLFKWPVKWSNKYKPNIAASQRQGFWFNPELMLLMLMLSVLVSGFSRFLPPPINLPVGALVMMNWDRPKTHQVTLGFDFQQENWKQNLQTAVYGSQTALWELLYKTYTECKVTERPEGGRRTFHYIQWRIFYKGEVLGWLSWPGWGEEVAIDSSKCGECHGDGYDCGEHSQQLLSKCLLDTSVRM